MEFHFKVPFLINQFASFLAKKKYGKNNDMELLGLWLVIKDKVLA